MLSNCLNLHPPLFHCIKLTSFRISRFPFAMSSMSSYPKVFVTRSDIPSNSLDKLKQKCDLEIFPGACSIPREALLEGIKGKDGLLCLLTDKIDEEVLNAAGKNLKVISTISVGFDHLSLGAIKERGIKVGYTPDVLTNATADLTIALLLAASRKLLEANNALVKGGWGAWSPMWMTGMGLSGSTVGIFGLGRIGQAVARRLQGFDVTRILYTSRSRKKEGDEKGLEFASFDTLVAESDFVVVTAALTDQTAGVFGRSAFSRMKPTAVFVNTSRGGLVDQEALIEALNTGQIAAAGLDVMTPEPIPTEHPLITAPNITLLPHIGSAEVKTRESMSELAVDNLIAGLNRERIPRQLC